MACNISIASYLCTRFCAAYHIMTPKHHKHTHTLSFVVYCCMLRFACSTPLFFASQDTHATHHLGTHANSFVSDRSRK